MTDIPLAVWLALFSVVAVPTVAWSFKIVREANRVVTLDGKRLDTIAAQGEYIAALEQKCKALETTLQTREHEYGERERGHAKELKDALHRIDELEAIVRQWRVVQDVQDRRAVRHEAREVRQEAREVAQEARATGEPA